MRPFSRWLRKREALGTKVSVTCDVLIVVSGVGQAIGKITPIEFEK